MKLETDLSQIDPDIQHQMMMVGFKQGQEHAMPSPKTLEMINNLKIDVAVINEKLDTQGKKIDEVLEVIKKHISDEENRYTTIMETKSDMWVQKFVIGLIAIVCTSVLGALLSLIIIK